MRSFTWLLAVLTTLAVLTLSGGTNAESGTTSQLPSSEWIGLITFSTGDLISGYGIAVPVIACLPADLPPEKHALAQCIAADTALDMEKLKQNIMADVLELKTIASGSINASRKEIRKLSKNIAKMKWG